MGFKRISKNFLQEIWDFLGFPLRAFILDEEKQEKIGLTTLKEERIEHVLKLLKGRVLDLGCGENELIEKYRKNGGVGIGADIVKYDKVDVVLNGSKLPFEKEFFDCVTIIASLNHIPRTERLKVVKEVNRILKPGGVFIITMLANSLGKVCHKLTYWDFDQNEREINFHEEDYSLSGRYIKELCEKADLKFFSKHSFLYGANRIYIFEKQAKKIGIVL
jgi:ubiquinone/menaquinone biosynthesis C-methylase UbiE